MTNAQAPADPSLTPVSFRPADPDRPPALVRAKADAPRPLPPGPMLEGPKEKVVPTQLDEPKHDPKQTEIIPVNPIPAHQR